MVRAAALGFSTTAAVRCSAPCWLLLSLHLLRLLRVFFLQLLGLLRVLLLRLLVGCRTRMLFGQLLMLFVLLQLQFLPILRLLRNQLVLLFLVVLVLLRVTGVWSNWPRYGWQFLRMDGSVGASSSGLVLGGTALGCYRALSSKFSGFGSCSYRRVSVIHGL